MQITLIVAAATNNAIGRNNELLWRLPDDLRYFKNMTWGMPVIMGRKTFESLSGEPLPGRVNIVVTRQPNWEKEKVVVAPSLRDAIFLSQQHDYKEVLVAGGGEIYREALPIAHKVYLTRVHAVFNDADTFFPELDPAKWYRSSFQDFAANEKHAYPYTFEVWERR